MDKLDYSCKEKGQPAKSAEAPIEQAYREQQQAFDRLLSRYLELYRIAQKHAHA